MSAAGGPGGGSAGAGPQAPNIVLIVTDDQDLDSYSAETMPRTSALFADGGTTFSDAIVTTSLCCPSRATMLTGQYAHNHGVLENVPGYADLSLRKNVLPVWLQRAGYETVHVGKFLNRYTDVEGKRGTAPGWDEWHTQVGGSYYDYDLAVNGKLVHYGEKPRDHLSRVSNRKAVRLVEDLAGGEQPYFLQLDHFAPHRTAGDGRKPCPNGPVPFPIDSGLYADEPLPSKASFNEADVTDKPSFVRRLPLLDKRERKALRTTYRCRLSSLMEVDRGVGLLAAAVESSGEEDNTVIIFTSDNGEVLGEHRLEEQKALPYEEATRVPMVVRVPEAVLGHPAPAVSDKPVANVDLVPTMLELADAEPCTDTHCRTLDGRSLLSLLDGGAWPPSRALLIEYGSGSVPGGAAGSCTFQGVRVSEQTYVEHTRRYRKAADKCVDIFERELYDLSNDPLQLDNLFITDAALAATVAPPLAARLALLHDCAGVQGRDPLPPSGHWCE